MRAGRGGDKDLLIAHGRKPSSLLLFSFSTHIDYTCKHKYRKTTRRLRVPHWQHVIGFTSFSSPSYGKLSLESLFWGPGWEESDRQTECEEVEEEKEGKEDKRKNEVRDTHTLCSQPLSVAVIVHSKDGKKLRIPHKHLKYTIWK